MKCSGRMQQSSLRENTSAEEGYRRYLANEPRQDWLRSLFGVVAAPQMLSANGTSLAANHANNTPAAPALTTALTAEGKYPNTVQGRRKNRMPRRSVKRLSLTSKRGSLIGRQMYAYLLTAGRAATVEREGRRRMKIGATFKKKQQRYECVGFQDHVNRFGRKSTLVILESRCAECAALFRFMATAYMARRRDVNRRCERHKQPGRPVNRRTPTPVISAPLEAARLNELLGSL